MKEKLSHVIYISADEEITTIADKLAKAKFTKIFLVVPPAALLIQSPINLRILKEEAESRGSDLTIVTTDQAGAALSEKAGIKCSRSILEERKRNTIVIKNKKQKVLFKKSFNNETAKEPTREIIFKKDYKNKIIFAASACFVCFSLVSASVFLPTANIFISAKNNSFENTAEVILNPDIKEVTEKEIPCIILKKTEKFSREFFATGQRTIKNHSSGSVSIFNEWDSSSHYFPAGAKIISESGKIFRLQNAAAVEGFARLGGRDVAGKTSVEIKAEEPGAEYNIADPEKFFILSLKGTEKYDRIYAVSNAKISGGSVYEEKVVLKEDLINANKVLEDYIRNGGKNVFGDSGDILKDSVKGEIKSVSFNFKEGDAAGSFKLEAEIIRKAVEVEGKNLQEFAERNLADDNFFKVAAEIISFREDGGAGKIQVKISGEALDDISTETIRDMALGKNKKDAANMLGNLSSVKNISVKIWPFWSSRIPFNKEKVNVFLDKNNYFSIIN